jgi:hypothetical protein
MKLYMQSYLISDPRHIVTLLGCLNEVEVNTIGLQSVIHEIKKTQSKP